VTSKLKSSDKASQYVEDIEFLSGLSFNDTKEWIHSEIHGTHFLISDADTDLRGISLVDNDHHITAILDRLPYCPKKIRYQVRSALVAMGQDWKDQKVSMTVNGMRQYCYLVSELKIAEMKPFFFDMLSQDNLPKWGPKNWILPVLHAAGDLSDKSDVPFWVKLAQSAPSYQPFIFPIIHLFSYDHSLMLIHAIDLESEFNREYIWHCVPNFSDYFSEDSPVLRL
jgi:hypothetical protein